MRRAFSVSIFAVNDGAVLLVAHARLGKWLPVGGEIEPGETPLEAARRELREETGLEGDFGLPPFDGVDGTPSSFVAYEEHEAGSKGLHMNFVFVARVATREVRGDGSWSDHRWLREPDLARLETPTNVRQCGARALRLAAARSTDASRA
ncbi:MAG: NUDIX domain-containing protein [Methanobacteriota archaeon]